MHLTTPVIFALASMTSLASAQDYLHPRALQARAFNSGYQAALRARWAEPNPDAEPSAYAYAYAEPGRENFIAQGNTICRQQLVGLLVFLP